MQQIGICLEKRKKKENKRFTSIKHFYNNINSLILMVIFISLKADLFYNF